MNACGIGCKPWQSCSLLFTGLVIHRPDTFSFMNFRNMVGVHNIISAILAVNAFLALFYHLASGDIQQYIPRPRGFFDRTFAQAIYYLKGIFKGEKHPFEKTPDKKLNPLQQVTYVILLNVLLPLQGITGMLMWGVETLARIRNKTGWITGSGSDSHHHRLVICLVYRTACVPDHDWAYSSFQPGGNDQWLGRY